MPSSPTQQGHRSRIVATGAFAALGLAAALGACGSSASKPSAQAIAAGLTKSGALARAGLSKSEMLCEAGIFREYGTTSSLNTFVKSKETSADANKIEYPSSDKSALRKKSKACEAKK